MRQDWSRMPLVGMTGFWVLAVTGGAALAQAQLDLGYYVAAEETCATASNASLSLVHWSGINSVRTVCDFASVTPIATDRYAFVQNCQEIGTETRFDQTGEILIWGTQAFELRIEGVSYRYRYCPQSDLPEPWRSNDLSDYQR